jgi:hypothetical protein
MIVKNNSKIILRCLKSCSKYIDYWYITDTGSNDDTIKIIKEYFKEKEIPGELYEEEFKDFSINRTNNIKRAISKYKNNNEKIYLMLLDSDFELKVYDENFKNKLKSPAYMLRYIGNLDYTRTCLVDINYDWYYKHKTHEYIKCDKVSISEIQELKNVKIYEKDEYKNYDYKFKRDIKLLKQEIDELKDDIQSKSRLYYYLGQSYECIKSYNLAIKSYQEVVKIENNWIEEKYYAQYKIGLCKLLSGYNMDNIIIDFLKAYEILPTRLEALYQIIKYYYENNNNLRCYLFACMADKFYNSYPNNILFIDKNIHMYHFWDIFSISCYYVGDINKFECIIKYLINNNDLIELNNVLDLGRIIKNYKYITNHRPIIQQYNDIYCIKKLLNHDINIYNMKCDIILPNYLPMNPSIIKTNMGYILNMRTVNYKIKNNNKIYYDYNDIVNTNNIIIEYDKNFNIINQYHLKYDISCIPYPYYISGFEDIRLFNNPNNNFYYFTATSLEMNYNHIKHVVLGTIIKYDDSYIINNIINLSSFDPNNNNKNWLPFIDYNNYNNNYNNNYINDNNDNNHNNDDTNINDNDDNNDKNDNNDNYNNNYINDNNDDNNINDNDDNNDKNDNNDDNNNNNDNDKYKYVIYKDNKNMISNNIIKDNIKFIHNWCPTTILKYDNINNIVLPEKCIFHNYNEWRGNAICRYNNGYLCIVHTSNFPKYNHQLLYLSNNYNILSYSKPFYFINYTIEFVCGITESHNNSIIITFGYYDKQAYYIELSYSDIDNLLSIKS